MAAARILRKLGRLLFDSGNREAARSRFAEAAALLEDTNTPIERPFCYRNRVISPSASATMTALNGPTKHCVAPIAVATMTTEDDKRSHSAFSRGAQYQRHRTRAARKVTARRSREAERSVGGCDAADLLGAACRGYTNLGVLYTTIDPTLAIDGLPAWARDGEAHRRSRLSGTPARQSRCRLLHLYRPVRQGRHTGRRKGDRDRPGARPARPSLRAAHRSRANPSVPRAAAIEARRHYEEALAAARDTGEPQLLFPCYDGLATLNLDDSDIAEAERYFALAQDVCTRHGLDPATLIVLPFLD